MVPEPLSMSHPHPPGAGPKLQAPQMRQAEPQSRAGLLPPEQPPFLTVTYFSPSPCPRLRPARSQLGSAPTP